MRRLESSKRVLLVVDENYAVRADKLPDSGVGKENRWISENRSDREANWMSALFVRNRNCRLPAWLGDSMPKGFDFNHSSNSLQQFPGAEQVKDLWRWIAGLPTNRDSATPIATLRERSTRLEQQAVRAEPSQWRSPDLVGERRFVYEDAPLKTFRWGFGDSNFAFTVSGRVNNSIYVYNDYGAAVGLIRDEMPEDADLERYLVPGRTVTPSVGQSVILMNDHGRLSVVEIVDVGSDTSEIPITPPHVTFRWRVIASS